MSKKEIHSETKMVGNLLKEIVLLPVTFIQVIIGKKKWGDLFGPLKLIGEFIVQPKFTLAIVLVNLIMFIGMFFVPERVILSLVSYPSDFLTRRFYTLITSGFLHAGWTHFIGNMGALYVFGRVVERKLGAVKTGYVYFGALIISGLFSSLIHLYVLKDSVASLGASGAVIGLVATAILVNPFYITFKFIVPLPILLIGWVILAADITGVLNPVEDGIGHFAHLGGFFSISILAYLFKVQERKQLKKGFWINVLTFLGGIAFFYLSAMYGWKIPVH